ncbi:hypothetical protein GCM10020331_044540 [Ectobacillus funiculus]
MFAYSLLWSVDEGGALLVNTKKGLTLVVACLLLACCSQREAVTSIYEGLERVASAERAFETEQEPLVLLEKERKKALYETILSLGLHDTAKRQELAIKAEESLEEREQHLMRERSGLYEAKKTFAKVLPLFEEIEENSLKGCAVPLTRTMQARYGVYEQLYAQYERALQKKTGSYTICCKVMRFRFGRFKSKSRRLIENMNRFYS